MATKQTQAMVDALRAAIAVREGAAEVGLIETHLSIVFLGRHHVYKLKKPVRFEFVDYSSLALREAACRAELELNRRWSPDVYLDVLPVQRTADGDYDIDRPGTTVDWLVRMKRLDDSHRLDQLMRNGELTESVEERLIDHLMAL
ncbi:MAG TPA: DNA-binding protein, partial [Planctomycetaceae bacterium]|nr:DNA-binding protein [Planctomycetaceae bacterium]